MQLDAVWRYARLSVDKIKEPNTGNLNRNGDGLERSRRREMSVKLLTGVSDSGGERTVHGHTARTRYLRDHGVAVIVLHDDVIVDVSLELEERHRGSNHVHRVLSRSESSIVRRSRWRSERAQISNGCRYWIIEINTCRVGITPVLTDQRSTPQVGL